MLGIDVSKDTLTCALLEHTTERFTWERPFPNNAAGVRCLLAATPATVPWVLEPTGRYSLHVAQQARAAGREVLLASPRKAKAYLASLQTRAKTDRLDSRGLAQFAASRPKSKPLPLYPIKSEATEQLDQLLTARKGLSQAIASLQQRVIELPHAAPTLQEAIASLKAQRAALDTRLAELTADPESYPEVPKLQEVPGIGPVTAAAVVSRLKARQFAHPDQFVAYIGLDVETFHSGRRKGERGLTKQGDAELRRLLFLCARATLTSKSSPFKAQYHRELNKGLSKTAATCAVARKLARLCWSLVKHNSNYKPERVYQQEHPKRPPASAGD